MSKKRFQLGDEVVENRSTYHDEVYRVLFYTKIEGKRFCGVIGSRQGVGSESELEGFISTMEAGKIFSLLVIAEDALQIWKRPVYVTMTEKQFEDLYDYGITSKDLDPSPGLPNSVDIRDEAQDDE